MTHDIQKKPELFCFLHIPKTAGTSFITLVANNFTADSIWDKNFYKRLEQGIDFSKPRLVRGHFGYWMLKLLPETPAIMTILREPHELVLSYYDHMMRELERGHLFSIITSKVSIDEIFDVPIYREVFSNIQTRYVVADLDTETLKECLKADKHAFDFAPKILIRNDDEVLTIAKNRLEQFAFVGIFEKLEDTLLLLYYTFGWFPLRNMSKLNVLPRRTHLENLSQETLEKINQATKIDTKLYDYGVKLFNERFSKMIISLKEKYYEERFADLSFKDMIYEMLEKHYFFTNYGEKIPFQSEIDYSFDQPMIGTDWHKHEVIDGSVFFRWTGPANTSTIYFLLNKNNDLKIRITILFTITQDVLDSLVLEVNEIILKLDRISASNKIILEGVIPKSILQKNEKNLTKLAFKVNQTISPATINPYSDDTRLLGIAFERIEINK